MSDQTEEELAQLRARCADLEAKCGRQSLEISKLLTAKASLRQALQTAAAIEGERDELLGGKILNQLVVHRLKTKLAALVASGEAMVNGDIGDVVQVDRILFLKFCADLDKSRETPQ